MIIAPLTQAILAGSQYLMVNVFKFTLVSGTTLYYTDTDADISVSGPLPGYSGPGAQTFLTGIAIVRGNLKQERGIKVQTCDLEMSPQADTYNSTLVAGTGFLQAVRQALFDSAQIQWWRCIFNLPSTQGAQLDTSPGGFLRFQGIVDSATAGRQKATLTLASQVSLLDIQMPRNLIQQSCLHSLYDSGCTLSKAAFTVTGTVSTNLNNITNNDITTNLTQPDDQFSLGIITFTSGQNNGVSRTVRRYLHTSGEVQFVNPPPNVILAGDAFSIVAGCPKTQAACGNTNAAIGPTFNNLAHNRSFPYVPVPETLYNGGVTSPTLGGARGSQGGMPGGSNWGSNRGGAPYQP